MAIYIIYIYLYGYIYIIYIYIYQGLLGPFGVRGQCIKVFWFFKSCRSRRELSNALVESVFGCECRDMAIFVVISGWHFKRLQRTKFFARFLYVLLSLCYV